jgi:hypothetical protein
MQTMLFHAHSGFRYVVLLAAVAAVAYLGLAWARGRPFDRTGRVLCAVFTGVLDLQVLLGLVLLTQWLWYGALAGHVTLMLGAAVAAHGFSMANRRRPTERRSLVLALVGVVLPLVLVVGGIKSIGRPLF